jgi:predicted O-methyltransferase YrrM
MRTLLHYLAVAAGFSGPSTQVAADELAVLLQHARSAKTIVEIGTFEGSTAAAMAAVTAGNVYTVDIFLTGRLGICYGERIVHLLKRRRALANLHIIKDSGHGAARTFDSEVDLVFIDADHSYEGAKQDWEDWTPKLRRGGVMALHDSRIAPSSMTRLGSMQFYEEARHYPGFEELPGAGSLAVFRKS